MPTFRKVITPLTIPSGQSVSNSIAADKLYSDCIGLALYGPAALDALTFTLEVSQDGTTFKTLVDGDPVADQAPPLATKARVYYNLTNFGYIRIKSSSGVAADRTWLVDGLWSTD